MKNFLVVALALLVTGSAFADTRLQVDLRPMRPMIGGGGNHRGVLVNSDGEVVYYESSVVEPKKNKRVVLTQLSATELEEVNAMIESARDGKPDHVVEFCEAIPMTHFTYEADNGTVALLSGARPCGGSMVNTAPEAKELVDFLNKYLHARN